MNMDFVFYSRSLLKVMNRVGIMEMAIPHTLSLLQSIKQKNFNLFTWTMVPFYSTISYNQNTQAKSNALLKSKHKAYNFNKK